MDIIPALDKPTAQEPLKVAGNNRKFNFQSSIVRLYFCEKKCGQNVYIISIICSN